jgi:hypothetical protein
METQLPRSHQKTYDAVLQHPAPHNLHWRDVRAMLKALGEAVEEPNGNLKVTRGGQTLVLHASPEKDVEIDALAEIRHFLQRSGDPVPQAQAAGTHLLVVLDHRQALIYRTEVHGSVPQRITPYDPHGVDRYLHYVRDDSNGQRRPELKSFYEAIAKTLQDAEQILLFGSGTGASSAMDQLVEELKRHHHQIAERIVGCIVVDEPHLSENQLLAQARDFYAKNAAEAKTQSAAPPEQSAPS